MKQETGIKEHYATGLIAATLIVIFANIERNGIPVISNIILFASIFIGAVFPDVDVGRGKVTRSLPFVIGAFLVANFVIYNNHSQAYAMEYYSVSGAILIALFMFMRVPHRSITHSIPGVFMGAFIIGRIVGIDYSLYAYAGAFIGINVHLIIDVIGSRSFSGLYSLLNKKRLKGFWYMLLICLFAYLATINIDDYEYFRQTIINYANANELLIKFL